MSKVFKVPPHDDFYAPDNGNFGRIGKKYVDWHNCRETFEDYRMPKRFLFSHGSSENKKINKFMSKVQEKMGLSKKDMLKVIETDKPKFSLIVTTSFWRKKVAR